MTHWTQYFEQIWLINLDNRPDRLKHATEVLRAQSIEFLRFPAIQVATSEFETASAAQYSCYRSHDTILKRSHAAGIQKILIFEDDIIFSDDFGSHIAPTINELLDVQWDMFWLGGINLHLASSNNLTTTFIKRLTSAWGTHAYALNLSDSFIQKYVEWPYRQRGVIDFMYSELQAQVSSWCASPMLAWQSSGYSDISKGWTWHGRMLSARDQQRFHTSHSHESSVTILPQ